MYIVLIKKNKYFFYYNQKKMNFLLAQTLIQDVGSWALELGGVITHPNSQRIEQTNKSVFTF